MALSGVVVNCLPSDGQQWASYICEKLNEYSIKAELCELKDTGINAQPNPDVLSVFMVTPDFLDLSTWKMLENFDKDKSLLVLTGTEYQDLQAKGPEYEFLQQWNIHELTQSAKSVNDMFVMIIGLYEMHEYESPISTPERPASMERPSSGDEPSGEGSTSTEIQPNGGRSHSFSVFEGGDDPYDQIPFDKKARQVNGVFDVMYKDGVVFLLLNRPAEGHMKVFLGDQPVTQVRQTEIAVYTFPYTDSGVHNISVSLDSHPIGKISVSVPEPNGKARPDLNKKTNSVSIATQTCPTTKKKPDRPVSTESSLTHGDSGNRLSSCRSSSSESNKIPTGTNKLEVLRGILEEEADPLVLMCKCFNLDTNSDLLDDKLATMMESTTAFSHIPLVGSLDCKDEGQDTKWPTLFHFAATYNLQKFCRALTANRLFWRLSVVRNSEGQTAGDLARDCGHTELAQTLRGLETKFKENVVRGDSGYVRDSISDCVLPPPSPHGYYTNIASRDEPEEFDTIEESDGDTDCDYMNKDEIEETTKAGLQWRCSESSIETLDTAAAQTPSEESNEYMQMAPKPHHVPQRRPPPPCPKPDSLTSTEAPPFELAGWSGTSVRYKLPVGLQRTGSIVSKTSDTSLDSLSSASETRDQPSGFRHKNLAEHLGMGMDNQKKQHKFKLFKKKNRSNSEPCAVNVEQIRKLTKRQVSDAYMFKPDSARTTAVVTCQRSATFSAPLRPPQLPVRPHEYHAYRSAKTDSGGSSSSGSNSTYLEISEVDMRGDQKSNSKLNFFKKTAKRKSMRLTKAITDVGDLAPSLPGKRTNEIF